MLNKDKELMLEKSAEAAQFLKLFAHEGRLRILCFLSEEEMNVSQLQEATELSQSQISQFLKQFEMAGVVTSRREGKWVWYGLSPGEPSELIKSLQTIFCGNGESNANR